ncbi:DUF4159 domain-containing protein [Calycomorphotria hydatis]|uniref:DUF4159 domain-containing protein n=1 Tax=Calycomorphotria hydatis TaxID=2528027 RepID=UPI0018D23619|nr:DUF4159 domain-containing protein [Calycomorphotria hydatis]
MSIFKTVGCFCLAVLVVWGNSSASAQQLSSQRVLRSIDAGTKYLISKQSDDGSWSAGDQGRFRIGVTSLCMLALLNSGKSLDDAAVRKGLKYLRSVREPEPGMTYEAALMIMALAAAKDGQRDKSRILTIAQKLENAQVREGANRGSWSYSVNQSILDLGGDRSNGQYAVLGLREAAYAGVEVSEPTWERIRDHWVTCQSADGGWNYTGQNNARSTGSMTVAGIATLSLVQTMLREDRTDANGLPICCGTIKRDEEVEKALERGKNWLAKNFSVKHNPGAPIWLLYYLYGLERAGRLSGERFYGNHDWYREGADFLVNGQSQRFGSWQGVGNIESDPIIATSFSLLFLSKGLAPVLVNKLQYSNDSKIWNRNRNDVRNLTEFVSGLEQWPRLVTWQVIDIEKVPASNGVADLLQAPVLYISGEEAPQFDDQQIKLLREYVDEGGFIFTVGNCNGNTFGNGMNEIVRRMYPEEKMELFRLDPSHPIYRSEYALDPSVVELYGVDVGCRTAIVHSPDDLSCLWDRWLPYDPPSRKPQMTIMITQKMRIGINVLAYATGREPPAKLDPMLPQGPTSRDELIERGLLQVAKIRHAGNWNAAPRALSNLLAALNRKVGLAASTKTNSLVLTDPDLFQFPLLYMHGRSGFRVGEAEVEQLRTYLDRGGVLFADACCGAKEFDRSFRDLIEQVYPEKSLTNVPADHELFSQEIGFDLSKVKRRTLAAGDPNSPIESNVIEGPPLLEAIDVDGRLTVIYSKYDISCALERQSSAACAGYLPEDATKIALNIVQYSQLQDLTDIKFE